MGSCALHDFGGTVRIRSVLVFAALIAAGALAAGQGSRSAAIVAAGQKLSPDGLRGVWKVSEQSIRSAGGAWSIGTVP